jgi:hypothetical protein
LNGLDFTEAHVLEWGSGNSTLYWSERAKSVRTIEHDHAWIEALGSSGLPSNVTLVYADQKDSYLAGVGTYELYDIVIVDGLYRASCADIGRARLREGGFIILDNSDWLAQTAARLRNADLIQIDFHGLGPINDYPWCTSFFLSRDFVGRASGRQPKRDPLSLERNWDEDPAFGR